MILAQCHHPPDVHAIVLNRYGKGAMGVHKIAEFMPSICLRAEVERRTNHCTRRTAITMMYRAGLEEKEIQRRTRHKSLMCLRAYAK